MKTFTDIEQSKKLAEILPIESADMFWIHVEDQSLKIDFWKVEIIQRNFKPYSMNIPCWSLAALLDMLPETIEDEYAEYDLEIDMIYKKPKYVRLGDCHHSDFPSWDWNSEELLDNIVEAVIWLKENNLL